MSCSTSELPSASKQPRLFLHGLSVCFWTRNHLKTLVGLMKKKGAQTTEFCSSLTTHIVLGHDLMTKDAALARWSAEKNSKVKSTMQSPLFLLPQADDQTTKSKESGRELTDSELTEPQAQPLFVVADFFSMALKFSDIPSLSLHPHLITRFKSIPSPTNHMHQSSMPIVSIPGSLVTVQEGQPASSQQPSPPYPDRSLSPHRPAVNQALAATEPSTSDICSSPEQWGCGGKWIEPYIESEARSTVTHIFEFWMPSSSGRVPHTSPSTRKAEENDSEEERDPSGMPAGKDGSCGHVCCSQKRFCFIAELKRFKDLYPPTTDADFKRKAIDKAILKLSLLEIPLRTTADVDAHVLELGERTRDKIKEIIKGEGTYWRTEALESDERQVLIRLFSRAWGVGHVTATEWVNRGFRSISEVALAMSSADGSSLGFTKMQRLGLLHYDDLQRTIPREEVKEVELLIQNVFIRLMDKMLPQGSHPTSHHPLDPAISRGHHVRAMGSFLGGKASCSDIDILVSPSPLTHPQISPLLLLQALLSELLKMGLILHESDPEASSLDSPSFSQRGSPPIQNIDRKSPTARDSHSATYSGLWKDERLSPYVRRIDIKAYPPRSLATACMYFGSSSSFNRAIKLFAIKHPQARARAKALDPEADHFRLNDVELVLARSTEMRDFVRTVRPLSVDNETAIFQALGLHYVPPHMRHAALDR